jgi:predicted SprT family Zn-dependent metalloprotease
VDHNKAETLARTLMEDHGLDEWSFKWDRALQRFGACHWKTHEISLSWYLVGLNDEDAVRDVILHEIAHALCDSKTGHSLRWKIMAVSIGCSSDTCFNSTKVAMPKAAWIGECPCGATIKRQRRKTGLYHVNCGGSFSWTPND